MDYVSNMLEYISFLIGLFQMIGLFMIDTKNRFSFFPGSIMFKRVVYGNMITQKKDDDTEEICDNVAKWAVSHVTKTHISHHWWYDKLPEDIMKNFDTLSDSSKISHMFSSVFNPDHYIIEPIHEMNEIYVTGDERKDEPIQSDRVFFISHIDGPFMWVPFVSVYRCLIGVNDNNKITTHFPIARSDYMIRKGDVLGFDFNREIHYISANDLVAKEPRVTLKAHYCIYPKWCSWIGRFMYVGNAKYNQLFRHLFLKTIEPETWIDRFNGFAVVASTHLFVWFDTYIGCRNVYFLSFLYYLKQISFIDSVDITMILYTVSLFKYGSLLFVVNHLKEIELWTTFREIGNYYFIALYCMFYYKVIV